MKARDYIRTVLISFAVGALTAWLLMNRSKQEPSDISPYEAKNCILRREADSLQTIASRFKSVADSLQIVIRKHAFSLDSLKSLQSLNRLKHENEILRIHAMPADSLFRFFAEYLSSNVYIEKQ